MGANIRFTIILRSKGSSWTSFFFIKIMPESKPICFVFHILCIRGLPMCTILTTVPRCSKEKLGSETMLSQIMSLVETAQLNRAPVERVADSVARIFVPSIVALSFLTWMTWYLLVYTWEVGSKPWKHLWDEYGQ